MEEIGAHHITSPFLATYIELWEPNYCGPVRQPWHYTNSQECIDLINQYGGMAIIAHPTYPVGFYLNLHGYTGIEIINGFWYYQSIRSPGSPNYIERFIALWDTVLTHRDTRIWGFAVNDWCGPYLPGDGSYIDCGKILVLLPAYTIEDYRDSLEKGRFFAIHDRAELRSDKNKYPTLGKMSCVANRRIVIYTDGAVRWIADGEVVAAGPTVDLIGLSAIAGYKYIRAEIENECGTVFTQPWTLTSAGP